VLRIRAVGESAERDELVVVEERADERGDGGDGSGVEIGGGGAGTGFEESGGVCGVGSVVGELVGEERGEEGGFAGVGETAEAA